MRNKGIARLMTAFMAVVLCVTAFSMTAFAYSGEDAAEDQEPDTDATETADEAETGQDISALLDGDISELLSALAGAQVNISVTADGIQITAGTEEPKQTGTVTTNGGNLNVRTGAGLDNRAFTQLSNGTTVEVIGTDGDWIKILLPARVGYVFSDYLTINDAEIEAADGDSFSLSIDGEELSSLFEMFMGGGMVGSAALTPDGNLSLIDDIGSTTGSGKQFITVETKSGNVFYLIIDRDDEGEETVHFLNQVDEADLLALMEDGETAAAAAPIVCTCTDKCVAGAVNTACPICAQNMSECVGKESEPVVSDEPEPEPEPTEDKGSSNAGVILLVALLLAAGGGAAFYFFVLKPKKTKKVPSDLDDFDLEDEEEYLNEDETEDIE